MHVEPEECPPYTVPKCSGMKTWLNKPTCAQKNWETSSPRAMAGYSPVLHPKSLDTSGLHAGRTLDPYFLSKLMEWVDRHKYLGVKHISSELIVVIILCMLYSRVSIPEGFEITSLSDYSVVCRLILRSPLWGTDINEGKRREAWRSGIH